MLLRNADITVVVVSGEIVPVVYGGSMLRVEIQRTWPHGCSVF